MNVVVAFEQLGISIVGTFCGIALRRLWLKGRGHEESAKPESKVAMGFASTKNDN